MIRPALRLFSLLAALFALWLAWVIVVPVTPDRQPYTVTVGLNRTMTQLARTLEDDGAVRNRYVMVALSRVMGVDRKLKPGLYQFGGATAMWQYLNRFADGHPDQSSVTIIEGWRFAQFRNALRKEDDLRQDTAGWSDSRLLAELGVASDSAEGLFFPSTYFYTPGSSDLDVYRRAYQSMQQQLQTVWEARAADLPYTTPYELLTMASLIEKETAHEADRPMVASVFVNRLKIGMRLQTDPSVIYGMGARYNGNIAKADLRRDTPYNTYTRAGLTPTPIALPGRAALDAAANPAQSRALYFVAKGDSSGTSQFSETLDEHNAAVRDYILKKGK
ncbi:endolytic transglycosylase MltG [Vogesella sp. XCS3]|uniref:endolytic transglycosylase MltG n=1 Tax=Vogesella sp. XCS3 TaxID=2877939 RepID=UPI001D0A665F|nr:endolytic transglycosylase MltG [Vogesella sp. XCS3]UDM15460.1 endolytic transglycosylase MltG [Vogesella sp. XCS3]